MMKTCTVQDEARMHLRSNLEAIVATLTLTLPGCQTLDEVTGIR
jgi:hypothetical protein